MVAKNHRFAFMERQPLRMQASHPRSLQSRSAASTHELVSLRRYLTPRPPFLSREPRRVITRVNGAETGRHVTCLSIVLGTRDVPSGQQRHHHH